MKKLLALSGAAIIGGTLINAGAGQWGFQHIVAFVEGGLLAAWLMTARGYWAK